MSQDKVTFVTLTANKRVITKRREAETTKRWATLKAFSLKDLNV